MDSNHLRDWDIILCNCTCLSVDLHTACSIGNSSQVMTLVAKNSDNVNGRNKHGWTPLMYASSSGHANIAKILIEHSANVNDQTKSGISPLILAARCGNLEVVTLLLQHGAAIELCDDQQWTPLFHAVYMKQQSVLHLLDQNANPNAVDLNGLTPFIMTASQGDIVAVKSFLKTNRVNIRHISKAGKTARSIAAEKRFFDVVHLIDDFVFEKSNFGICKQQTTAYGYESDAASCEDSEIHDLQSWLGYYGFSKYYYLFVARKIDLTHFLMLEEQDLDEIGIKLVGPRRKMCTQISNWRNGVRKIYASKNVACTDNLSSQLHRIAAGIQRRF